MLNTDHVCDGYNHKNHQSGDATFPSTSLEETTTKSNYTSHIVKVHLLLFVVSFTSYICTYSIRSPMFVSDYSGLSVLGGSLSFKVALASMSTLGSAFGKVPSIYIIPQLSRTGRLYALLTCQWGAQLGVVSFGVWPSLFPDSPSLVLYLQLVSVFIVFVVLSPIFGTLVMYLEGRFFSDMLITSFFFCVLTGAATFKTIASYVLGWGGTLGSTEWMPTVCSVPATFVFTVTVVILHLCVPDPSEAEVQQRSTRQPMSMRQARAFLWRYFPGLFAITLSFAVLTAFRWYRDFFAPEIWLELAEQNGSDVVPDWVFLVSEVPAGICATLVYASLNVVQPDRRAFLTILVVMVTSATGLFLSTIAHTMLPAMDGSLIGPLGWNNVVWMTLVVIFGFIAYTPPGANMYDRMMGMVAAQLRLLFGSIEGAGSGTGIQNEVKRKTKGKRKGARGTEAMVRMKKLDDDDDLPLIGSDSVSFDDSSNSPPARDDDQFQTVVGTGRDDDDDDDDDDDGFEDYGGDGYHGDRHDGEVSTVVDTGDVLTDEELRRGYTSVFMIFFSDGMGYLATLLVLGYFNFISPPPEASATSSSVASSSSSGHAEQGYYNFFLTFTYSVAVLAIVCNTFAFFYFKAQKEPIQRT